MQKINNDIFLVNKAIYLDNTIVISDIHIGYEEALNMQGVLLPRIQFKEIIDDLDQIFDELKGEKLEKIIINGDLKHEFGKISDTEWRHTLKLIDYLEKKCKNIILIQGNHDKILEPLAKKRNLKIKDYVKIKDRLIIHGDKLPKDSILKGIKTIIIGHEHPAVTLRDGIRIEKFKCFLNGKWKKYNLIVAPSFTPVTEGTDILSERLLSPFLEGNLDKFEVFVVADTVYDFGKLKNLK